MKYYAFFTMLILYRVLCRAEFTNFDFYLGRYLIDEGKSLKVTFKNSLSGYEESDFLLRPISDKGIVEVYSQKSGTWVGTGSSMDQLPSLEDDILIKINGFEVEKTFLYFEVFNTVTGEVYKTPKKTIWSYKVYSKYLESVNKVLSNRKILKEESNSENITYLNSIKLAANKDKMHLFNTVSEISDLHLYPILGILFFISCYIGYSREKNLRSKKISIDTQSRIYISGGKIQ